MRGRGRPIATVLADALRARPGSATPLAAAAFAEVVGWPLAREVQLRGITRDGRLLVVARSEAWAEQLRLLTPLVVERLNARLGTGTATGVEVRVGPLER